MSKPTNPTKEIKYESPNKFTPVPAPTPKHGPAFETPMPEIEQEK